MDLCGSFAQANPLARLYVTLMLCSVFRLPKYDVRNTEFVGIAFCEIEKYILLRNPSLFMFASDKCSDKEQTALYTSK
jgi:hypothetical protein